MPRWTLQMLQHIVTATTLRVITNTSRQDHLYLSWSYTRPGRELIYRTVRGKLVRCGYKYIWNTPITVEQIELGATWTHTFYLTGLVSESRLWYYLHAPCPPSDWETQGPLQMVDLLHAGPPSYYLYFASRLKGMFMTTTFTAPDGPDPVWVPDNAGLGDLHIRQAALAPYMQTYRRYVIAGGHLYIMNNWPAATPATATTILTWPQAIALTGCVDGTIVWVEPNARHPGMLHVLWSGTPAPCSYWHLRSLDYGEHWTAHQIAAATGSESAGNIQAGFDKGTSPYGEGDVVYAAINLGMFDTPSLARSLDQGATWTTMDAGDIARGTFRPRVHVDRSNQAVLYIGCHPSFPKLYRSQDHGDSWDRVDRGQNFTVTLEHPLYHSNMQTHLANPDLVRAFRRFWIERSDDYCESWEAIRTAINTLRTGTFTNMNPNLLYLAKVVSGTAPPPVDNPHVIFVSTDEGATVYPKAGANAHLHDGGGDSIPYDCGGAADDGILVVTRV